MENGAIPSGVRANKDIVIVKSGHTLTINVADLALSRVTLEENAHLIVNENLLLHGDGGQDYPIDAYDGSTVTINANVTDEKGVKAAGRFTIKGDGNLEVQRAFESATITFIYELSAFSTAIGICTVSFAFTAFSTF